MYGQLNGFGAEAKARVTLSSGGTSSRSSSKTGKSPADKSMAAELAKKAAAEAAGAIASDIGSRFFAGETSQYVPARQAITKTISLYNQAIGLANAGGVLLVTGVGSGVTAAQRATDYQDRIEELNVASQAMVPEFAKQVSQGKLVPKKSTTEKKFIALSLFGKSMGIKSAQLEPEPQGSSMTTWLIVGAVVLAAGGGYYYYTTTKKSA